MTRQQRRAHGAYGCVMAHKQDKAPDEYRSLCLKMPALLKQSGLVQALALMRARGGLGKDFCDDLSRVYGFGETEKKLPGQVLQEEAQKAPLASYLTLSRDMIDISVWFRRFAQSELKTDSPDDPSEATSEVSHVVA